MFLVVAMAGSLSRNHGTRQNHKRERCKNKMTNLHETLQKLTQASHSLL